MSDARDNQGNPADDMSEYLQTFLDETEEQLEGRRLVRVALEFFAGPSAQGQFHEEHVRHFTLGVYIDP